MNIVEFAAATCKNLKFEKPLTPLFSTGTMRTAGSSQPGVGNPFGKGVKRHSLAVVFLCLSYLRPAVCRMRSVMAGLFWASLADGRTFTRYFLPQLKPVAHAVGKQGGGFKSSVKDITA